MKVKIEGINKEIDRKRFDKKSFRVYNMGQNEGKSGFLKNKNTKHEIKKKE